MAGTRASAQAAIAATMSVDFMCPLLFAVAMATDNSAGMLTRRDGAQSFEVLALGNFLLHCTAVWAFGLRFSRREQQTPFDEAIEFTSILHALRSFSPCCVSSLARPDSSTRTNGHREELAGF